MYICIHVCMHLFRRLRHSQRTLPVGPIFRSRTQLFSEIFSTPLSQHSSPTTCGTEPNASVMSPKCSRHFHSLLPCISFPLSISFSLSLYLSLSLSPYLSLPLSLSAIGCAYKHVAQALAQGAFSSLFSGFSRGLYTRYIYIYICILYVCVYIYITMYICIYIYIYILYIYIYIYMYIHIYTCSTIL